MSTPIEFATWVEHVLVSPLVQRDIALDLDLLLKERVIRDVQRATGKVPYPTTATVEWSHLPERGHPDVDLEQWRPEMYLARLSVLVDA